MQAQWNCVCDAVGAFDLRDIANDVPGFRLDKRVCKSNYYNKI